MPGLRIMRFIYNTLRRHPDISKIIKIVKWLSPNNITETRAFIKVTVYYRIFIKNFALVAAPIYSLIRKKNQICLKYGIIVYHKYS
jgi:hypothetical protein